MEDQFEKLVAELKSPVHWRRNDAVTGLKKLGDPRAIEPLIEALADPEENISAWAASCLGSFGDPAFLKLLAILHEEEDTSKRTQAVSALASFEGRAFEPLLAILSDETEDPNVKLVIMGFLEVLRDSRAIEPLALLLFEDPSSDIRETAGLVLGNLACLYAIEKTRITQLLIKALADPAREVRIVAIDYLGNLEAQEGFEPLLKLLADPDDKIRESAIDALRKIGNREAIEFILGYLNDKSSDVRAISVWALGELEAHQAVEKISGLLTDSDERVRFWAAWSLAMLGDERGFAPMLAGLSSPENWHRYRTAEALGKLGNRAALSALMQVELNRPNIAREVIGAVVKIGTKEEAGNYLLGLLGHEISYFTIKAKVIKALGEIGFTRALPELKNLVEEEDPIGQNAREAILKIEAARE
ncbi:MAG: HEAT repeat domain-containing protein [Chloroflexi bacterium]|nr:HEAT repeat domain-containing protein [Chloroflexota bacterium]OJV99751.1 MAG: hypothetical protein BGO39_12440 [Chloroflexi bacterium 54-19]